MWRASLASDSMAGDSLASDGVTNDSLASDSPASGVFSHALSERLAACGDPAAAPEQLAELFRWSFSASEEATVMRRALHAELLRWTIRQASAHTRFYSRPIYQTPVEASADAEPDLSAWPVIRRADVIENLHDMHADNVTFGAVCHTSGCTGAALPVFKSAEELAFIWDYQTQMLAPIRERLATRPLVLTLPNLYHGTTVKVPSIGRVFVGGVTDDLLIDDVVTLLRQRIRIPGYDDRLSIITALVHQMLFLTSYLLERGIDPRQFGVKSLNVVGGYLSTYRREYLHDAWGAMVFDRFSLTESAGGATRCHACGYFHLDPHVIGEVLAADADEAVDEGVGRLVLTELYPFVRMQPFIRYETGDMVRRVRGRCQSALTFEFLGKTKNCLGWRPESRGSRQRMEWLIFSAPLLDVLDPIPDFQRVEQFRGVMTASDPSVGSLPLFTLESSEPRPGALSVTLTIALRYAPAFYPERVAELRRLVTDGVLRRHESLARRVAEHTAELDVRFVSPGALRDTRLLKV